MSISSNMQQVTLQTKKNVRQPSGTMKEQWIDEENKIFVSIFKISNTLNTNNAKYNESTHAGFTFYKSIKEGINRIVDSDGVIYDIINSNSRGRLANLLLKVVDFNV